jgi:hypothetical protein
MVADDDDRQVGLLRQRAAGAGGVISRKPDLHSIAGRLADAVERRHSVGGVPRTNCVHSPRGTDDGNRPHLGRIDWHV